MFLEKVLKNIKNLPEMKPSSKFSPKIFEFAKKILPLIILPIAVSCAKLVGEKDNNPTKIRIVDINGNAKPVKLYVPESNAQILANQEIKANNPKINEVSSDSLISKNEEKNPEVLDRSSLNTTQNYSTQTGAVIASSTYKEISKQEDQNLTNNNEKIDVLTPPKNNDNSTQEPSIEYDMSDSNAKEKNPTTTKQESATKEDIREGVVTKKFKVDNFGKTSEKTINNKNSNENKKSSAYSHGIFVQIGSFTTSRNANKVITSAKKMAKAQVKEIDSNGKKSYQVLLGPVKDKQKAKSLVKKAKDAGYKDAFIVKE